MTDQDKTINELMSELIEIRQKAEQRLQLLSSVVEQSSEGIAVSDLEGYLLFVNSAFAAMHGYTPQELVGKHLSIFHTSEQIPAMEASNRQIRETGEFSGEIWHVRRDGVVFPTLMHNSLLRNDTGNPVGMIATLRDITERKKAEEALRESEERYRELAESITDVFFAMDEGLRYTYWNRASEELTGISAKDALGKHLYDLFPRSEMTRRAEEAYQEVLRTKKPKHFINEYQLNDRHFFFEISAYPSKYGLSVFVKDITERKRLEHHLNERVKELNCLYGISKVVERPGITPDELYQEVANLLPPSWRYPEITSARITINGKEFKTTNFRETERKQSSDIKVEGAKVGVVEVCYLEDRPEIDEDPFLEEERLLIGAVAERLGRITERKRAEEALRESEEKYRQLVEHCPDTIAVHSDGKIDFINPAGVRLMRAKNAEQLIGKPVIDFLHPDYRETVQKRIAQSLKEGAQAPVLEEKFIRLDGKAVDVEVTAIPFTRQGMPAMQVVVRDITERKRLEQARVERAVYQARAKELQRSRHRIVTVQESLRRDIAKQLHGSVQNRLIILLHRLTELEHATSPGELAAELGALRQGLGELLENGVRPISYRLYPSILRRGLVPALQSLGDQFESVVAIEMELDEELMGRERSDRKLISEPVRLAAYRIAEEALTNVVKHARASRVTIGLQLSSEGWLRLTVRDNGQGFDMGSTSGELGILMMRDYAEVMGGECVIRSAAGEGTEVTATLPLAESGTKRPGRASPLE